MAMESILAVFVCRDVKFQNFGINSANILTFDTSQ